MSTIKKRKRTSRKRKGLLRGENHNSVRAVAFNSVRAVAFITCWQGIDGEANQAWWGTGPYGFGLYKCLWSRRHKEWFWFYIPSGETALTRRSRRSRDRNERVAR
jgi:hypothetical protein